MVYVYDCLIQFYQFFIELCYFNKKEIFKLIALNSLNCVENSISYKSRNPPQTVNQIAVILESITIKKVRNALDYVMLQSKDFNLSELLHFRQYLSGTM